MGEERRKRVTVIHCWSAPRSRSTALLYSFEARGDDCVALDEPLYREWCIAKAEGGGVERPYIHEIVEASAPPWACLRESLGDRILRACEHFSKSDCEQGIVFCKHMAKHCGCFDFGSCAWGMRAGPYSVLDAVDVIEKHVLLIRDPVAILSSWASDRELHKAVTPEEVGVNSLMTVYTALLSKANPEKPLLLDSDDLIAQPSAALEELCRSLDIPYSEAMLSWQAGPHACDGPWASWWYGQARTSTGWRVPDKKDPHTNKRYRVVHPEFLPALTSACAVHDTLKRMYQQEERRRVVPYEDPRYDSAARRDRPICPPIRRPSAAHPPLLASDSTVATSSHANTFVCRNASVLCWVGSPTDGRLHPRCLAGLSPFDSSVQGGDACWEGLRVYRGRILSLDKHLARLFRSARGLGFKHVHSKEAVLDAIFQTLSANGMRDGAHIRLTLTRGEKYTSSMNPNFNVFGTTLIVLAEWKAASGGRTTYDNTKGIKLITASQVRLLLSLTHTRMSMHAHAGHIDGWSIHWLRDASASLT